jgi:hypothetical protein
MPANTKIREALQVARAEFLSRKKIRDAENSKVTKFMRARVRAENQFKAGLWERLVDVAQINKKELNERLKQDRISVEKFINNRKNEALESAREVKSRHIEMAKGRIKRIFPGPPNPPSPGAPAPLIDILFTANGIDIQGGDMNSQSIAKFKNLGKVRLFNHHDSSGFSVGSFEFASIVWRFVWNPPRQGEISVWSFLSLNGHESLFCEPGCFYGASAGALVSAQLSLNQIDSSGSPFTQTSLPVKLWDSVVHKDSDDSTGQIDSSTLDQFQVLTSDQNFVLDGLNPVIISVELDLRVDARRAEAMIDLSTGAFAANTLAVIIHLN